MSEQDHHRILCEVEMINDVKKAMETILGPALSAKRAWIPREPALLTPDHAKNLDPLLETLQETGGCMRYCC